MFDYQRVLRMSCKKMQKGCVLHGFDILNFTLTHMDLIELCWVTTCHNNGWLLLQKSSKNLPNGSFLQWGDPHDLPNLH